MKALTYPLQAANGKLQIVTDYPTIVQNAIVHVVNTKLGELVWNPEYGTGYLVFDKKIPEVMAEIRTAIDFAMQSYPDVVTKLYYESGDTGNATLTVSYQVPDQPFKEVSVTL